MNGVACAPGLRHWPSGTAKPAGSSSSCWKAYFTFMALDTLADGCLESILDLMLDNKDHRLKACAAGIVKE